MGVTWDRFSLYTFLVPIATALAIMGVAWVSTSIVIFWQLFGEQASARDHTSLCFVYLGIGSVAIKLT